jgi:hypothetical protein
MFCLPLRRLSRRISSTNPAAASASRPWPCECECVCVCGGGGGGEGCRVPPRGAARRGRRARARVGGAAGRGHAGACRPRPPVPLMGAPPPPFSSGPAHRPPRACRRMRLRAKILQLGPMTWRLGPHGGLGFRSPGLKDLWGRQRVRGAVVARGARGGGLRAREPFGRHAPPACLAPAAPLPARPTLKTLLLPPRPTHSSFA